MVFLKKMEFPDVWRGEEEKCREFRKEVLRKWEVERMTPVRKFVVRLKLRPQLAKSKLRMTLRPKTDGQVD